jgi:Glycosyl hydrolases family 2, sugar binding domain/Glycosyl hydrolases family 2, TIM barrel domain/Glycosyl hydrolases family 2
MYFRQKCGMWRVAAAFCLCAAIVPNYARGESSSLDGEWHFAIDPQGTLKVADLRNYPTPLPAIVPGSWQSEFADLRDYAGVAWYWRSFTAPALAPGQTALLHFGAVDYRAAVYVNGQKAGKHDGGYLPFDVAVTTLLHAGENQLAVRVVDPGAKPAEVEGINYAEIPHGKQNWYVQTSGLWQSVQFEVRPSTRINTLHIRADASGKFQIDIGIISSPGAVPAQGPAAQTEEQSGSTPPHYAGAQIRDPSGKIVWKQTQNLEPGQTSVSFSAGLPDPELWSLDSPDLYTLEAWLFSGDTAFTRFGFRTFATRDGRFYLNGQPIYLRGALDQDFYPDTAYTPPSLDYIKHEMQEAKRLGLNLLRCHIKVPDPRYLQAADETGILVWYEIPNWDKLTAESERRAAETLEGMVERDWNHPSIIAVSLINESWGVNLKQAADRAWLKRFAVHARQLVPGWLVDDNSACCDNFHMSTDIADFHTYDSIPDAAQDFDHFVTDLAGRPASLWSPDGDSQVNPAAPLMLSEFGNWGLPHLPETLPWWFERSFGGREITLPGGLADRFTKFHFESVFPNLDVLADATEAHEYRSLKYEIESLRSHASIQGYVITEFTDVDWESNGLLDMWRHPKDFGTKLAALQQDDFIAPQISGHNFRSGEHVHVNLSFSHFGGHPLAGAQIHWQLEGFPSSYIIPLPAAGPDFLMPPIGIDFTAPQVKAPERRTLSFSVEAEGQVLVENSVDLYVYPPRPEELRPAVAFEDSGGRLRRLAEATRANGYLSPSGEEALPVLIASSYDARVKSALEDGGRVILIASEAQTLPDGLKIVRRAGSDLEGNWISNFLWLRKNNAAFSGIGFDAMPGFETQAVTPRAVIEGVPDSAFEDVLAGEFYGWLHSNVAVLLQARVGAGKLLVTTFGFDEAYGTDPYATTLLDNLMRYVVSDFKPSFELSAAPQSQ